MNWWGSGFITIINYSSIAVSSNPTPPPSSDFRITDTEDFRITDNNDNRITDS